MSTMLEKGTQLIHGTVAVKDIRMHYVRAGAGDEVVVLIHGWPQSSAAWHRIIPALANRYTVIAPDIRGLGSTSKARSGYDMNNVADDVHQLLTALQLNNKPICIAGHDWGAVVAYTYAAQFRAQVRRLAFFEMVLPGLGMLEQAMVPQPHGQFLWHLGFQSVPDIPVALMAGREDQYLGAFFERFAYDPHAVRPELMRPYVESMQAIGALRAGMEYYVEYFRSADQVREHSARKLSIPVLAMAGEACLGAMTKQCLEIAAEDVRGGVIERCGHWIGEERPDYIAQQLLEFFGESN